MALPLTKIAAVFMRGGTSKGLFFHERDLPPAGAQRDALFCAAMGTPDPFGRQLDGMGGALSSLSKIAIVAPSSREDCDVDYTFGQVAVFEPVVEYGANCGNLSSAVGPFAVEEGLVPVQGDEARVRIYNTNTDKIIHARFALENGLPALAGDFVMPGIATAGAPVALDFIEPAGAATGHLLPTGNRIEALTLDDGRALPVSLVDAAMPMVFVPASALGLQGTEMPAAIEADRALMATLASLRAAAARVMGIAEPGEPVPQAIPKIALVSAPSDYTSQSGEALSAEDMTVVVRVLSMGNAHQAVPLTTALCVAVASRIPGTVVAECAEQREGDIAIAHPGGILPVDADVQVDGDAVVVRRATVYRTARRLFEGRVCYTLPR